MPSTRRATASLCLCLFTEVTAVRICITRSRTRRQASASSVSLEPVAKFSFSPQLQGRAGLINQVLSLFFPSFFGAARLLLTGGGKSAWFRNLPERRINQVRLPPPPGKTTTQSLPRGGDGGRLGPAATSSSLSAD